MNSIFVSWRQITSAPQLLFIFRNPESFVHQGMHWFSVVGVVFGLIWMVHRHRIGVDRCLWNFFRGWLSEDTACDVSLGWIRGWVRDSGLGCDCEWLVGFCLGLGLWTHLLISFPLIVLPLQTYSEVGLCPGHVVKKKFINLIPILLK